MYFFHSNYTKQTVSNNNRIHDVFSKMNERMETKEASRAAQLWTKKFGIFAKIVLVTKTYIRKDSCLKKRHTEILFVFHFENLFYLYLWICEPMYVIICPMCMAACGEWKGASDSFRDELQAAVSHWTRYYELKDPVSLTSKPSLKLFFF